MSVSLNTAVVDDLADLRHLAGQIDEPAATVSSEDQLQSIGVLVSASKHLLEHARALVDVPGASLTGEELALIRAMMAELDGNDVGVQELRLAIGALIRP
jgi:hypothetical protein